MRYVTCDNPSNLPHSCMHVNLPHSAYCNTCLELSLSVLMLTEINFLLGSDSTCTKFPPRKQCLKQVLKIIKYGRPAYYSGFLNAIRSNQPCVRVLRSSNLLYTLDDYRELFYPRLCSFRSDTFAGKHYLHFQYSCNQRM